MVVSNFWMHVFAFCVGYTAGSLLINLIDFIVTIVQNARN